MPRENEAPAGEPRLVEDVVPAMVWAARPDMSCDYLSRAWLDFTGSSPEEALGEGWSRGVHPEDLARWLDACVRAFDSRQAFEIEYRLRRRDGEYRWVLDRGVPRYAADGSFVGFIGACVDIDERKRAAAELARALERERRERIATEEASRLKDGFVAAVLTGLRSPVDAIAAWARHLREQVSEDSEAAQALEAIERNARTHSRTIANLLELSRFTAGAQAFGRPATREPLLAGIRVLVVDDDRALRESVSTVLEIAGAQTRGIARGEAAMEALEGWRPDVLLAEVAGPGGAGYALIRSVRSLPAERGGCLRAAALIAGGRADEGRRALAAGYDAQLAKPIEPVALLAAVARLAQA